MKNITKIKITLAFSNSLFSEGIGQLLANDPDMEVCSIIEPGQVCTQADLEKSSVILTDFTFLYNNLPEIDNTDKKHPVLLVDTSCGRENLVSAVLHKKISGVLLSKTNTTLLKKAIKAVHQGEVWLDKNTVKSIIHGVNAIKTEKDTNLSSREKEIVSLIGKGLRNKEIASKLHITDTTVKTHLTHIFQKLNLKGRSELISYAIKSTDLSQFRSHREF